MLYSDKIVNDPEYLSAYLPGCDHIFFGSLSYCSRPLVVQICGNDPTIMAHAATAIALTGFVDAVDFNLGCPQKRAIDGHYGSYLLDKCHWPQVFECVKSMANALKPFSIPLFCKIRLIEGANCVDQTTLFCRYILIMQFNIVFRTDSIHQGVAWQWCQARGHPRSHERQREEEEVRPRQAARGEGDR